MRIEHWKHIGVRLDGTLEGEPGAVATEEVVRIGAGQGCGLESCHCSDGYWITISFGRDTEGTLKGVTIYFDNAEEFYSIDGIEHVNKKKEN